MTYESDRIRVQLREIADEILAEPNLRKAADMTGEFRRVSAELGRELLGKVGYRLRDKRTNMVQMQEWFGASRDTINEQVLAHCRRQGLPMPRGFQRGRVDPDQIVRLPGAKGDQLPRQPRSSP